MFKLCALSMVLCLLAPSRATTPGTVVRVNQEALEYVCQQGRPFLLQGLMKIQIPAFKPGGFILGQLLNIVGIKILDVQLPHLSVKLIPKTGVQLSLSCHFHISGNIMEFKVGSSILLDVRLTRSPHGFPILSITACKSILGDVQVIVGGNNLLGFLKPLQNHIRAILIDKMCLSVSNVVLGLNAKLGTMVDLNTISRGSHLGYSLLEQPEITSDYIDLGLNAAFELMGKPIEDSSPSLPFSLPPQETVSDDSMMNMGMSEQMFRSYFATLEQSGAFNLFIGGQSGSGGIQLSTSMLQSAIPSLSSQYPQDVAVALNVVLAKLPVITLVEGGAVLSISPAVQVAVGSSASSSETLCTLEADVRLGLQLSVTTTSLKIVVALQGAIGLEVVSSSVKVEQVDQLREIVVSVFEKAYLLHLNAVLSVGVSLPKIANIQYVDPAIEIHKGYAQVNCDLDYLA
ncbi:BPI fold-containing family B member 2 [Eublepharis macularius]|uniref:BPI fold-containing family B member 2 n=1 Tax=Eublepharis macularius TaxID=481883 RepID=A0AA97JHV1_EUBMA|nr:BPI fold-containing family B member 2 [Eublepharis macularius]